MRKIIGLCLLFSLFGCSSSNDRTISAEDALGRIEKGAILLDVREPDEYEAGHIADSINVPLKTITKDISTITDDKEAEIIVYCRSGNRSKQASEQLLKLGYKNVYDLGGINKWPYDIVK